MIQFCRKKCCKIHISKYSKPNYKYIYKKENKKAGVFIYDPDKKKILIVQSRGNLWGAPKGSLNTGETEKQCAIRELKEETGILLDRKLLERYIVIRNKATYYYIELPETDVSVQNHIEHNDANAISWINIDCLLELIIQKKIILNSHCKINLRNFLGIHIDNLSKQHKNQ